MLLPGWIAILFAISATLVFLGKIVLVKHMCSKRVGFDPSTLTFSSLFVMNAIILLVGGYPYWS